MWLSLPLVFQSVQKQKAGDNTQQNIRIHRFSFRTHSFRYRSIPTNITSMPYVAVSFAVARTKKLSWICPPPLPPPHSAPVCAAGPCPSEFQCKRTASCPESGIVRCMATGKRMREKVNMECSTFSGLWELERTRYSRGRSNRY